MHGALLHCRISLTQPLVLAGHSVRRLLYDAQVSRFSPPPPPPPPPLVHITPVVNIPRHPWSTQIWLSFRMPQLVPRLHFAPLICRASATPLRVSAPHVLRWPP